MVTCTLCGFRFAEADATPSCAGCPVSTGCGGLCCPNCGFTLAENGTAAPAGGRTLAGARPGEDAVLGPPRAGLDDAALRALIGLGLLPGVSVRVLARRPAVLLRVGRRTVTLDRTLAAAVTLDGLSDA